MRLRKRREGPLSSDQRSQFLAALSNRASVERAAEIAGRHRRRFYEERERNPDFRAEWERATAATPLMEVASPGEPREEEQPPGYHELPAIPRFPHETTSDYNLRVVMRQDEQWRASLRENGQDWRPFTASDAWRDVDTGPPSWREPGKPRFYTPTVDEP